MRLNFILFYLMLHIPDVVSIVILQVFLRIPIGYSTCILTFETSWMTFVKTGNEVL